MPRQPDIHISEKSHYAFLHAVGMCALTGAKTSRIEIEHIRHPAADLGMSITGMGQKPHYLRTIPLAAELHHERHNVGQKTFYGSRGVDMYDPVLGPFGLAMALAGFSAMDNVIGARAYLTQAVSMRIRRGEWKSYTR